MQTKQVRLMEREAFSLWPRDAIDLLCRDGEFDRGTDAIFFTGKSCCIVGALNRAAAIVNDVPFTSVSRAPGGSMVKEDYERVTGTKAGLPEINRMRGLIARWDRNRSDRGDTFTHLCEGEKNGDIRPEV